MLRQRLASGALEVYGLEQAVEQGAGARPFREGEDGGLGRLLFLRSGRRLGHYLVIEAGVRQDPLAVAVPLGRQPGVGADPPVPLEGTGKVTHLRLPQLLLLWRQRGRTGERGLTDGHPGQRL
ncbi:hypothetical protein D3C85_1297560 [compost metagenome]